MRSHLSTYLLLKLLMTLTTVLILVQYGYAENEIYGTLSYDYQNTTPQSRHKGDLDTHYYFNKNPKSSPKPRSQSNINNADSHIGIKGQKDIGNGNAIIYQLEWGKEK